MTGWGGSGRRAVPEQYVDITDHDAVEARMNFENANRLVVPCVSAAVAGLAIGAAGCGPTDLTGRWTTTVDTLPSGVVHVVNSPPAAGTAPTWMLEEELRIGTVEGEGPASFGSLRALAVLDDGSIAVIDYQAQEVRVFGPDGGHRATLGGPGEGPGEFTGAWGLMVHPDGRLWVADHGLDRMSVFEPGGDFVESHTFHVFRYGYVWDGAMGEDGRVYKPSMTIEPPRPNLLRVYGESMELLDSLPMPDDPDVDPADPPGSFYWEAPGGMPRGYMSVPFYPSGHRVIDSRGRIWTAERGDPSYRIKRWTAGGDTTLVIETRRAPVAVAPSERDSAIDAVIEDLRPRGAANQDWSKIPEIKPSVEGLFLSDEGNLWVRTPSGGSDVIYDVHGADGSYLGTAITELHVSSYIRPIARGDLLWAIVADDLDVQYVVRARLVPAR